MELVSKVLVVKEDIDLIGHVNNIKYVSFLENARGEWFAKTGIPYKEMHKRNVAPVILRLDIMFMKEAKLADVLNIITCPVKLGNKSFVLKQNIFNQFEELTTEAAVTMVMFDINIKSSIEVIDEIACKFPKEI